MAHPGIVIEQLFSDLPSLALHSTYNGGPIINTIRETFVEPKTMKSHHTRDSWREKTVVFNQTTTPKRLLSANARRRSLGSDRSSPSPFEGPPKFPMTYDVALTFYGDQLTPFERAEITNYSSIYTLGLNSKKIQVFNQSEVDKYDDDEYFYRAVPHDHIAYRYEITDRPTLGKGTFGQVIKAFDHKEKQVVALKLVRNERTYLKQSRDELRILQVLRKQDHGGIYNIIRLHEFFMFRNHMCMSFELLGINLFQVMKKNQFRGLGASKIMLIARNVLKCLELLYKNRIIHCDLKPENIMLKRNGDFSSVKVGDFGSSCYEQQQVYSYIIQSRYYRAPEVILGMRYGPAIDMWSLGCVLGELSCGVPIFAGKDELDQLAAIEEVMGKVPMSLMSKAKHKVASSSRAAGRGSAGSKSFSSIVHGDDLFKDFVKKMLAWDPQIRPSPSEIADHRWIKNRITSRIVITTSNSYSGVYGYSEPNQSRTIKSK